MFINKGLIKYILAHHTMKYSESVKQNEGLHTLNMKWSLRYTLKWKKIQAVEQYVKKGLRKKYTPLHTYFFGICISGII